jgi:hypothetical protein
LERIKIDDISPLTKIPTPTSPNSITDTSKAKAETPVDDEQTPKPIESPYEKYSLLNDIDFHTQFEENQEETNEEVLKDEYPNNGTIGHYKVKKPTLTYDYLNEQWCQYLQTYPEEPDVLLYPRMPKCGSSTLEEVIATLSKPNNFIAIQTQAEFWKNLDGNLTIKHSFLDLINHSIKHHKKRIVIDGHFEHVFFQSDDILSFDGKQRPNHNNKKKRRRAMESIQLIRDCTSRSASMFFYELFDNAAAREAKAQKKSKEHLMSSLHIPPHGKKAETFRFEDCLEDYRCVKGYPFENYHRNGISVICGVECIKQVNIRLNLTSAGNMHTSVEYDDLSIKAKARHIEQHDPAESNQVKGALLNSIDPEFFTAIGTLEYMEEYFEMLECAYPTIFRSILTKFHRKPVHANTGSANSHYNHSDALTKAITEACDPMTSDAGYFYQKLLPYLRSRYQFMKLHKKRCCRSRLKVNYYGKKTSQP